MVEAISASDFEADLSGIDTHENAQIQGIAKQIEGEELSLGHLILKSFDTVEKAAEKKTNIALDVLEGHQKNLDNVVRFLARIEEQIGNDLYKEVEMRTQEDLDLIAEMRTLLPNLKLLEKATWTKDEARILQQSFNRCSQTILQQIQQAAAKVNRSIEDGTELLQIARKCLDMLHQLHQTLTSNQRSR